MESFVKIIFSGLFGLLGVASIPHGFENTWTVESPWAYENNYYHFKASTTKAIEYCHDFPESVLVLPQIIHSAQTLILDGKIVAEFGDKTFDRSSSFYEQLTISCSKIAHGRRLEWIVTSYSYYFARFGDNPFFTTDASLSNFFNVTANVMAFGILLVLSLFSFIIYRKKVSNTLTASVSVGSLLLSFYFMNVANETFGLNISMLKSHKFADMGLWLGIFLFFRAFEVDGLCSRLFTLFVRISCIVGVTIIFLGRNGDEVQFGTMIPMLPFTIAFFNILFHLGTDSRNKTSKSENGIRAASILSFLIFGMNDILHIMGVIQSVMLSSVGIVGCILGLSIAVVRVIDHTYKERDDLLTKLEEKVKEKTTHLEEAMSSLKSTQAELVQSAKLASLGTLSAGIAHEINNAINYVNGALIPLEKKINQHLPETEKPLVNKLLSAIKEGTSLTVEIVKSLRNYTGLNQAELKDVALSDAINSVTTILKSKLREVNVTVENAEDVRIFGNTVGLNQIFMNFFTNSLDAFDKPEKEISIRCSYVSNNGVSVEYRDNGSGIPESVVKRIFDPFFTTKDVGKGTGLGLHIVKKEIERHGGTISVESRESEGTLFRIIFPREGLSHKPSLEAA